MVKQGVGVWFVLGIPSEVSWCDAVLNDGAWGWVSCVGCGVEWSWFCGMELCMCFMVWLGVAVSSGRRWSKASNRSARDLLTVAILCRKCSRCVVSGWGSRKYRYRFRAVAESCTSILGMIGAIISSASIVARISAVLMLVLAVPMFGGRYVVLVMIGMNGCVYHDLSWVKGSSLHGKSPSVALAVIIGMVWLCWGGVSPPSTVSMIGDVEDMMVFHIVCMGVCCGWGCVGG